MITAIFLCYVHIIKLKWRSEQVCVCGGSLSAICVLTSRHHHKQSSHVLSATNRFDPDCEPHLDEVLNQESIHYS